MRFFFCVFGFRFLGPLFEIDSLDGEGIHWTAITLLLIVFTGIVWEVASSTTGFFLSALQSPAENVLLSGVGGGGVPPRSLSPPPTYRPSAARSAGTIPGRRSSPK